MPLQSSGAISLNDIQTEFGGTNPININEYYRGGGLVPNITVNNSIPTSGTIALSNFYGTRQACFITSLTASNSQGRGVAVDSSLNCYITGVVNNNFTDSIYVVAKYNSSGTLQWQRTLNGASAEVGRAIAVDSSANVYVAAITNSQSAGGSDALIVKYNTNGVIQWQVTLGGSLADRGHGIALDSSANVYIGGNTASSPANNTQFLIAKYNTNGTLQWQRTIGGSGIEQGNGIAVDSSGNSYVAGSTSTSGGALGQNAYLVKYNTNGTLQWQRGVGTSGDDFANGIGVDSSGNVYIGGHTNGPGVAGNNDGFIAEYDTNGNLQWQRCFGDAFQNYFNCIATDSAGNSYGVGYTPATGCIMAKYNTSGTLQWQRSLSQMLFGWGVAVDSTGSYYVTGEGTGLIITAKFPGDGSATGTYGGYTYSAISYTSANITVTSFTPTFNEAAGTLSSVARTLTDAAATYGSTTTIF